MLTMAETGKRIADDWEPGCRDIAFARSRGLGVLQIREIAETFRDYWVSATGQRATKRDWSATWRNWIRKERPAISARYSAVEASDQLEVIAAHVRRPWCERGAYPRDILVRCVEAELLTRDEMEAAL